MEKQTIVVIADGSNVRCREIVALYCKSGNYTVFIPVMKCNIFPAVGVKTLEMADIILFLAENENDLSDMAPIFSQANMEKTICIMEREMYPLYDKVGFENHILCERLEEATQIILEILSSDDAVISLNVKDLRDYCKGTVGHLYYFEDEHERLLKKLRRLVNRTKEKKYKELLCSKGDLSLDMVADYADELGMYNPDRELLLGAKYDESPLVSLCLIRFELA